MADAPLLEDLIDKGSVAAIAAAIGQAMEDFDEDGFVVAVFDDEWESRELKQRVRLIARTVRSHLAGDFATALAILRESAPTPVSVGLPLGV